MNMNGEIAHSRFDDISLPKFILLLSSLFSNIRPDFVKRYVATLMIEAANNDGTEVNIIMITTLFAFSDNASNIPVQVRILQIMANEYRVVLIENFNTDGVFASIVAYVYEP
ncbi:protein of unknown function [Nitrosotalea devaniterrae]|uniref:Uncharacterized protein n=1 Tax=Nitrosotalea devaniterrae TaxID=1078905 RepID=A0A128A632_9ARCH|nr:protein of unknown function [Candidatus Nitrosotalea devanaterra]